MRGGSLLASYGVSVGEVVAVATSWGPGFLTGVRVAVGGPDIGVVTPGTGGSSVEVFGVIDAGVSHVTNKSDRR